MTSAEVRAARVKAREWAKARGYARWMGTDVCYDECSGCKCRSGAMVPLATANGALRPLCWDCIPYDGAPVRNHESHSTEVERTRKTCIRCERKLACGGTFLRGGPFCWKCPRVSDATYHAWLIAIRAAPDMPPPWAGDCKVEETRP